PQGSSPGQFLLEESVVWTGQFQEFCGTSILWMELAEASRLTFHLRPGQEIVRVVDRSPQGAPLPLTDDRTTVLLPHREGIVSLRVDWVDRTPSGEVMLLNYRDLQPQNRLLAVVSGRDQVLRGNEAHQLTWLATVLTRWESLLECLDQSRIGEIPIDGPLLKTIRRCQRTAGESLSQVVPSRSDELLEKYRQLEEDWHTRQERFAITSDLAELSGTAPVDAFSVLLTQREHFVPVAWYDLSERAAPLRVHLRTRISTALVPILAVLLLGLSVTVVARYQARILSFREQCARHPILMLSVLGLVWWLFLVPSVVGLLLMLLAGVTRIGLILLPHAQSHSGGDRGSTVIGERPESAI
ncbi:MAG: hypothetical protein KDA80_13575, partial [Planctomycetaceae bacterium]|nr:hypothetical protein [Planctomycetaceae bacterium]